MQLQTLVEVKSVGQYKLKMFDVSGTYVVHKKGQADELAFIKSEPKKGSWKAIRFMRYGRDWSGQKLFVLIKPKPVIVELDKNIDEYDDKLVEVKIISGGDQIVFQWEKRPYISRKTGAKNPNLNINTWDKIFPTLSSQYGVWNEKMVVFKKDLIKT